MTDSKKKPLIDQDRFEKSEKLQQTVLSLMMDMKDLFSTYQEYKTIIMNLTTVSKELNSIRIKEITGDTMEQFDMDEKN